MPEKEAYNDIACARFGAVVPCAQLPCRGRGRRITRERILADTKVDGSMTKHVVKWSKVV